MKCKFCNQPSRGNTTPPMCDKHADLAVICVFLDDEGVEVTSKTVQDKLTELNNRGKTLDLKVDEVPAHMKGFSFEYQVEGVA